MQKLPEGPFQGDRRDFALKAKDSQPLPLHTDLLDLLNNFSDFFQQNITKIREKLDAEMIDEQSATALTSVLPLADILPPATFNSFEPLTIEDVTNIITSCQNKSCALDSISTWFIKELCAPLAPVISKIVNLSLQTRHLPISLKKKP